MTELDNLTIEDLYGEQKELAECIGIEAYRRLIASYGGLNIYICKADTALKNDRDCRIRHEFNGGNYKYLAVKYNLSERTVRQICLPDAERARLEQLDEQLNWKDLD